jgi:hypothetical protein
MGARKRRQGNHKINSSDVLEVGDRSFTDGQNEKREYMRILERENRNIGEEITKGT